VCFCRSPLDEFYRVTRFLFAEVDEVERENARAIRRAQVVASQSWECVRDHVVTVFADVRVDRPRAWLGKTVTGNRMLCMYCFSYVGFTAHSRDWALFGIMVYACVLYISTVDTHSIINILSEMDGAASFHGPSAASSSCYLSADQVGGNFPCCLCEQTETRLCCSE
jgi:hypothetical protein